MQRDHIEIFCEERQTVVRISESGTVSERRFDYIAHARAWAEGQGIRLNVPVIGVPKPGEKASVYRTTGIVDPRIQAK